MKNKNIFNVPPDTPMNLEQQGKVSFAYKDSKNLAVNVQKFSAEMISKLIDKSAQGWHGWDNPNYEQKDIIKQIKKHLKMLEAGEIQEIDIANLCMFYWFKRGSK